MGGARRGGARRAGARAGRGGGGRAPRAPRAPPPPPGGPARAGPPPAAAPAPPPPPALTPVGEFLFATGQFVSGGPPVLAVVAVVCRLRVVVAAGAGAAVRAGRWRWPPASHGGGTTEPRCGPHRSHLRKVRAAQPRPWPRPAIERAPEVHLHLHGVSAEDVAVILVRRDE